MVVLTDPGSVPENWRLVAAEDNLEAGSSSTLVEDAVEEIGLDRRQDVRYCARCENWKPPRCHHCSICQRCVLKMDHHCVWVVNCVGACNYKFFLLFLFYTFLETIMVILVLLPSVINLFSEAIHHSSSPGNLAVLFLSFVLNLAFALSLLCFTVMHASLLSSNTTSIEVYEKKGTVRWKYDLGRKRNFEQVFGTKKVLWFFPVISREDSDNVPGLNGLNFPTRSDVEV